MAQLVSSALIEEMWRTIGASSSATIRKLQKQCGKEQEELTGFLLGFTSDLRPEGLGLALYIHLVVVQAFRPPVLSKYAQPGPRLSNLFPAVTTVHP